MKKISIIIFVLLLSLVLFSSCSTNTLSIEDYEWQMRTVMSGNIKAEQNKDSLIVAVGKPDEIYPNAVVANIKLKAAGGKITITDKTNEKVYYGTYKVIKNTPKGTDYEIEIDSQSGYATVAPTQYYDGSEIPTLPINLGEYSLYFIPEEELR